MANFVFGERNVERIIVFSFAIGSYKNFPGLLLMDGYAFFHCHNGEFNSHPAFALYSTIKCDRNDGDCLNNLIRNCDKLNWNGSL